MQKTIKGIGRVTASFANILLFRSRLLLSFFYHFKITLRLLSSSILKYYQIESFMTWNSIISNEAIFIVSFHDVTSSKRHSLNTSNSHYDIHNEVLLKHGTTLLLWCDVILFRNQCSQQLLNVLNGIIQLQFLGQSIINFGDINMRTKMDRSTMRTFNINLYVLYRLNQYNCIVLLFLGNISLKKMNCQISGWFCNNIDEK